MFESLSDAEKKRAIAGAIIASLGAFVLGGSSLGSVGTPVLVAYFGSGVALAGVAIALLVSLR